MIGLGKKQGGLYTLQSNSPATLSASVYDVLAKLSRFYSFCFNLLLKLIRLACGIVG